MSDHLIRCFIAIRLPDEIRESIRTYTFKLQRLTSAVRWVKVENIHLTLKFLGEISPEKVNEIEQKLNETEGIFAPFDLSVSESGCFPGRKNPRIFWLGLEQGMENPLFGIYQWIEDQLSPLGFAREKRRFSPHLTLGRVKNQEDFSELYSFLDQQPFKKVIFNVDKLSFIRSELKPTGAEYTIIHEYFF